MSNMAQQDFQEGLFVYLSVINELHIWAIKNPYVWNTILNKNTYANYVHFVHICW